MKRTPKELSEEILRRIEADPKTWNQQCWHSQTECGTAHCYAGWCEVILAEDANKELNLSWCAPWRKPKLKAIAPLTAPPSVRAALGLNPYQWYRMTAPGNSLEQLRFYHNLYFGKHYHEPQSI